MVLVAAVQGMFMEAVVPDDTDPVVRMYWEVDPNIPEAAVVLELSQG